MPCLLVQGEWGEIELQREQRSLKRANARVAATSELCGTRRDALELTPPLSHRSSQGEVRRGLLLLDVDQLDSHLG